MREDSARGPQCVASVGCWKGARVDEGVCLEPERVTAVAQPTQLLSFGWRGEAEGRSLTFWSAGLGRPTLEECLGWPAEAHPG
jgi:hypothetical protein